MSRFSDDFAASAALDLEYEYGDVVTYTTVAGVASSVTGMVGAARHDLEYEERGRNERYTRVVSVPVSDLAAAEVNATLTISGVVWTVIGYAESPGFLDLSLERIVLVERGPWRTRNG